VTKVSFETSKFHRTLLSWYKKNKRSLPWRENRTWYSVWISEIMLQQTQVQQVIPYFLRFISTFPDVRKLAAARLEKILKVWAGLGYYSRARNLHQAARMITNQYHGSLPDNVKDLARLPGFGPYTIHAVLSIVFNKPLAAIDGNVIRIACRLFKIRDDLRLPATRKKIQRLMNLVLDQKFPGLFNEALMELGATICLPLNPRCTRCPLRTFCSAYKSRVVGKYPFKSGSAAKPTVIQYVLIIQNTYKFLLVRRKNTGLLSGLWEFPMYPLANTAKDNSRQRTRLFNNILGSDSKLLKELPKIKHSYTHFNVLLVPFYFQFTGKDIRIPDYKTFRWTAWSSFHKFPMHRAMHKLIHTCEVESVVVSKR